MLTSYCSPRRAYCFLGDTDMKLIDAPHNRHGWEVKGRVSMMRWPDPPGGRVISPWSRWGGTEAPLEAEGLIAGLPWD